MKIINKTIAALGGWLHKKGFFPGPGGIGWVDRSYTNEVVDIASLEKAFQTNPFVYRCVEVISDTMAAVRLRFYREVVISGKAEREEVTDHPLVDLLWNPGPRTSGYDIIKGAAAHIKMSGESFWFIENGSTGESLYPATIERLQPLKPRFIKNVSASSMGVVDGYTYSQAGQERTYEPEFIVHIKTFNPESDTRGLSPITVARSPVLLHWYMERHNQLFFKNGANPGTVLAAPGTLTEDTRKALQESWDKRHQGSENAHKTAVLEGGLVPHQVSINAKDGEFIGLHNVSRDQVLAILGVPPMIVGVFEYANYANSTQQMRAFYQYTIQPLARLIENAINTQLIPTWFGGEDGLYCEFDFSGVDVLQDDREAKARIDQIYVQTGIKTPNEVRLELSLEPVEGGDDLRGAGGGFLISPSPQVRKAAIPPTRVDQWKARDADFRRGERALEKAAAQFFEEQGERVLEALAALGELSGGPATQIRAVNPDDLITIFDSTKEDNAILDAIMPTIIDIMIQAGNGALASIDSGVVFNEADPRVEAFLAKKELKVTGINRVTQEKLRKLLVDATADTQSVHETSRQIRKMFTGFSKTRADTIARTEVVSANNAAAVEGYRQSGIVRKKQWLAVQDGSARESHAAVDGEEVGLDSVFSNGLPSPGVDGPPEEVINCRCTVLPVLDDE